MKHSAPHLITVALRMAGIAGQDKLNGIFEYLSEGHRWQLSIYRTADEFSAKTVAAEIRRGTEGFIVGIPGAKDALAAIAKTRLPTVLMNISGGGIERRPSGLAFVMSDSIAIGRSAAIELLKQGAYKSYGFAGYRTDDDWSRERGKAFRATLKDAGLVCGMFDLAHYPNRMEDRDALVKWLRALPKPCGILAACDDRAFEILDACHEAGLDVPAQVGVLGVNNDPILCENAEPRLSSIQPNFILEGRRAAELMDRMLASPAFQSRQSGTRYQIGVRQIVHRDSTRSASQAGLLVQRALAFIEKNALNGIGVQDVARHLKVSYSLINLRFHELQHQSLYNAILDVRLSEVRRMLRSSSDSIESISYACGWTNATSLKSLFKRRYGMSMTAWRLAPAQRRPASYNEEL